MRGAVKGHPHFFPYFSLQLFPYFSIYYSVQLAYIIWQIIVYMYRARIMREFICFYLLSMYNILVKSIYNIQNLRPRYSTIHTIFWQASSVQDCISLSLDYVRSLSAHPESIWTALHLWGSACSLGSWSMVGF